MRYTIYWLPHNQSSLHQYGKEWFEQTGKFQTCIDQQKAELSHYDFVSALKTPQKYGFHAEILPPFSLKMHRHESEILKICQSVARLISVCDIKICLIAQGKSLLLKNYHKNNVIHTIRHKLYAQLLEIANFEQIFNFQSESFSCCQDDFQITLSNTTDILLQNDLMKIAKIYWQDLLKYPLSIEYFSLCYQKDKTKPFIELTQFHFDIAKKYKWVSLK